MKYIAGLLGFLVAVPAMAAVTVVTAPASLVTTATTAAASSGQVPLFEFALNQDAGETLSSVVVHVASATATSADLASASVYKDDGDGSYDAGDMLAGTNATVNVGTDTSIATASNNALSGGKFFVTLATSASWAAGDSITVTMPANAITTSANSPTSSAVTTAAIAFDATAPTLVSAVAQGTGATNAKEAGDSVLLTFSEATNKATIDASNINTVLVLNNSHSWLDGVNAIGSAVWNAAGTQLTVTLSGGTSLPTVAIGDTVTIGGSVIKDLSNNNATGSAAIGGSFTSPDTTGPVLSSAVAKNTGGTSTTAVEAGDSVVLGFSEATNKPAINSSNINTVLALNNSHSWLDGAGAIGSANWSSDGKVLTVVLSAGTSAPTVAVGDTVTIGGSVIKDASNNNATGSKAISGSFVKTEDDDDEDEDEDDDKHGKLCANGLRNGKLYKTAEGATVYLAAGCRLKPFRGAAVFHARGHKFRDIIVLSSLNGIEISQKPALPAGGTLIKGSAKTVWFVTEDGKIKGFTSEKAFRKLGFFFNAVKLISDSDLSEMQQDPANIDENSPHPEGAVLKCTTSQTVYMMKGNKRLAFTNPLPYLDRGHTWDAIAIVDCKVFTYPEGAPIAE